MCRSQAEGGRRCPGRHRAAGHAGDGESYQGTPWQGYDEAGQRADEINRRILGGETITDIMRADQLERGKARIAQIAAEGW